MPFTRFEALNVLPLSSPMPRFTGAIIHLDETNRVGEIMVHKTGSKLRFSYEQVVVDDRDKVRFSGPCALFSDKLPLQVGSV